MKLPILAAVAALSLMLAGPATAQTCSPDNRIEAQIGEVVARGLTYTEYKGAEFQAVYAEIKAFTGAEPEEGFEPDSLFVVQFPNGVVNLGYAKGDCAIGVVQDVPAFIIDALVQKALSGRG